MPDGSSEELGSFCSFQDSQTAPERRKWRRIHGLQLPLHPQQAAGWLAIVAFAIACFVFLIPALASTLRSPIFFTFIGIFSFHIVTHLTAVLLDPAEDELRKIGSHRVVPEFDRGKHAHVIENGRCHLCNILTSSPRTKHCSVCNKCVSRFDHHCKWLNHCVGGRNYVAFFMCVVSAVTAALAVLAVALAELVLYYVEPEWLSPWESIYGFNDTMANATAPENEITKALAMQDTIFLLIVGILGLLAAVSAGLLLHLCFFHVYISFLGLTTYEYLRNYRQPMSTAPPTTSEQQLEDAVKNKVYICSNVRSANHNSRLRHRPSSLYCCNTSSEYYEHTHNTYYFCSVLDEAGPPSREVFAAKTFQCCAETKHYRPDNQQSNLDIEQVKTVSQGCTVCTVKTRKQVSETGAKSCVMKTINKHHRWKRKWNCCSTVPESPVTPENNINSILSGENGVHSNCGQTPNDGIAVISSGSEYQDQTNGGNISKGDVNSESSSIDQRERSFSRPWSMIHFRRMYRALNRMGVRRQRKRVSKQFPVRVNQVDPISTVHITDTDKEALSEQFLERLKGDPVVTKLPSLPPPVRRKIKNVTDLQELADSLATAQIQQAGPIWRGSGVPPAGYRRGRRKNLHTRPRSPTLSPIRESGLSNPASPQPCRAALALCPTRPVLSPENTEN